MQTLIFPGFHSKNKDWVDAVAANLKFDGLPEQAGIIRPFYWSHWTDETKKFNATEKSMLIAKHVKDERLNIIAKSIGTLVCALTASLIPDKINKIILCGIPVNDIGKSEIEIIKKCIQDFKDNVLVIQNMDDPHGSFEQVKNFGNVKMKVASDHNYPYFDEFNEFLTS